MPENWLLYFHIQMVSSGNRLYPLCVCLTGLLPCSLSLSLTDMQRSHHLFLGYLQCGLNWSSQLSLCPMLSISTFLLEQSFQSLNMTHQLTFSVATYCSALVFNDRAYNSKFPMAQQDKSAFLACSCSRCYCIRCPLAALPFSGLGIQAYYKQLFHSLGSYSLLCIFGQ